MYVANKELDIEDFLSAINFVPPSGMSVAYILTPQPGLQLPPGSGFQAETLDIPEDESIKYVRTEPQMKIDGAMTPADYSVFEVPELGRRIPTLSPTPKITEPEDLPSPFVKVLSESMQYGLDIMLRENWKCFPKNTIFHCVVNRLKENTNTFEQIYREGA
jgi:hypothetical protein